MPLDGTNNRGATAVRVIDLMLKMFNGGAGWHCDWTEGKFRKMRCMESAIRSIQATHHINGGVRRYICQAIKEIIENDNLNVMEFGIDYAPCSGMNGIIIGFNDSWMVLKKNRYKAVIEPMLMRARQLAEADI